MIKELEHPLPLITGAHPFQKKLYESITKEKNKCESMSEETM